ncbi:MAG: dTDP-4-dehydrorhamnose reductase [Cytophagales bacterium]|nr:MAG: dTDP-4-dehydrorhamnose reductase [Cytophagales bacterium]
MNILVTGSNGQLGSELKKLVAAKTDNSDHFFFTDIEELNITDETQVKAFFEQNSIDFCINAAAYTAVDKAENEPTIARSINVEAVRLLAVQCQRHRSFFIHISTDYVFDGMGYLPYTEENLFNPQSIYGETKAAGEMAAIKNTPETIIIRTSWLYSTFGNNFVKTMLRLAQTKPEIGVVADQIGTPTYAGDLAQVILHIIAVISENKDKNFVGTYHYSNEGVASWYDFAHAIFEMNNLKVKLKPISTKEYPTPARRPAYSVLDKSKIKKTFGIEIPHWRESLKSIFPLIDR